MRQIASTLDIVRNWHGLSGLGHLQSTFRVEDQLYRIKKRKKLTVIKPGKVAHTPNPRPNGQSVRS